MECFAIEQILGSRRTDNKLEYLIKWKEFPDTRNSWEPVSNLFSKKKSPANVLSDFTEDVAIQHTPAQKRRSKQPIKMAIAPTPKRVRRTPTRFLDSVTIKTRRKSKSQQTRDSNREVDRVENLRKHKDRHEYLVKWKNGDNVEWIGRDIMITKYPQTVIAFFERITTFKYDNE